MTETKKDLGNQGGVTGGVQEKTGGVPAGEDTVPHTSVKPSVGRIVLFYGIEANGMLEHPAIITQVHSDEVVNLTIFLNAAMPQWRTSVQLYDPNRPRPSYWRWPPRV
jgi:hypothetical protein